MSRASIAMLLLSLATLTGCTGQPAERAAPGPTPAKTPETPGTLDTGSMPVARHGAVPLPVVAAQWGQHQLAPPSRLTWPTPDVSAARRGSGTDARTAEVTIVGAPSAPSYVSFMTHREVDSAGIPDEDGQMVTQCGEGITDPGCRVTEQAPGKYLVRTTVPLDAAQPFRILYVQWAPETPGGRERWASWQLPADLPTGPATG